MERRVTTRGVVTQDGKILAVKHKREDGTTADFWAIPGGGLDSLETLHDGVRREIMEELGIEATVGRLLLMQQFKDAGRYGEGREFLEFFFEISNAEDFIDATTNGTSHGEHEIAEVVFVNPREENILPKIIQTQEFADVIRNPDAQPLYFSELS